MKSLTLATVLATAALALAACNKNTLERVAVAGDSPVCENDQLGLE